MKNTVKVSLLVITLTAQLAGQSAFAAQPKDLPKPTAQLGTPVSLTPQVPSVAFTPPPAFVMPPPAGVAVAPAKMIAVTLAHGIGFKEMSTDQAHRYPGLPVVLDVTNTSDILPAAVATGAQCRITATGGSFGGSFANPTRPYFHTIAVGCFDHGGRSIAQGELEGYLVGSDNVLGLRGLDDIKVGTKATVVVSSSSILHITTPR